MNWFRFYSEALDDPKVQRLKPEIFKAWVNLLCLASKNDGVIPPLEDVAFALRVNESTASKWLDVLAERGLIDQSEQGFTPHGWANRQYKSDVSSERVKRFRKRKGNGEETPEETPPEQSRTETDTETEQKVTPDPLPVQKAVDNWNIVASTLGLVSVRDVTPERREKLRQRLRKHGIEKWNEALENIEGSRFLRGENDRRWRVGFDWMLKPSNFIKVLEGAYADDP